MGARKGIITLTLVISRESESSTVRRGAFVMFNIFKAKIKTKLEIQIEDYIEWKASPTGGNCPWIAEEQDKILRDFIKQFPHTNISEVTLEELETYYEKTRMRMTEFLTGETIKAIRAFFRFHKRHTTIKAWQITGEGIKKSKKLQSVVENVIIPPMKRKRTGRPYADVELIKKIKRLKDREDLSFRKIGLAVGKDVSHVYRMYRYNLTQSS